MANSTDYEQRLPASAALRKQACEVFPDGITSEVHRCYDPIFFQRGSGSRVWDVDGNEYIDYVQGSSALMLGFSHPAVSAALQRQIELGSVFAYGHPLAVDWAAAMKRNV